MHTIEQLERHREILRFAPCDGAVDYLATQPDFKAAWDNCPRGDWMESVAKKLGVSKRTMILAKSLCAKTVYHLMPEDSKKSVDIFERYGRGEATEAEFKEAKKIANAAYADVATFAAYAAAYDAAYDAAAAAAAYAAAYDAAVAYDFYAALSSANSSYYEAKAKGLAPEKAKEENLAKTADIYRQVLTKEVFEILNIEQ